MRSLYPYNLLRYFTTKLPELSASDSIENLRSKIYESPENRQDYILRFKLVHALINKHLRGQNNEQQDNEIADNSYVSVDVEEEADNAQEVDYVEVSSSLAKLFGDMTSATGQLFIGCGLAMKHHWKASLCFTALAIGTYLYVGITNSIILGVLGYAAYQNFAGKDLNETGAHIKQFALTTWSLLSKENAKEFIGSVKDNFGYER